MKIKGKRPFINSIPYQIILFLTGLICAHYIKNNEVARKGLEYLWLVPLSFSICVLFFKQIIPYHKNGIGLKILYLIIIIRYLVSPYLISTTQYIHFARLTVSADSYRLAVFVTIIELVVACATIRYFWPYYMSKIKRPIIKASNNSNTGIFAWVACAIILVICAVRIDNFGSGMHFLFIVTEDIGKTGAAEGILLMAVKTFIFIRLLIYAKKKYAMNKNIFWVIFVGILAFLNVSIYYGSNRSLVFQTIFSTLLIFIIAFPRAKKPALAFLMPASIGILLVMIFTKQFGISGSELEGLKISLNTLSEDIEMYVNGMWPLASSLELANSRVYQVSLLTIYVDFVKNFFPFMIPGLNWPIEIVRDYLTTAQQYNLATGGIGAMLPLAGQMWMYGGKYGGMILTVIANAFCIALLVRYEILAKKSVSYQQKYLYIWLSALFALTMCYCLITFVWSWSKYGLLLMLLYWTNNIRFKVKQNTRLTRKPNYSGLNITKIPIVIGRKNI